VSRALHLRVFAPLRETLFFFPLRRTCDNPAANPAAASPEGKDDGEPRLTLAS
jgi:hypothetical protein